MTKKIPDGELRLRPERACLACRRSKTKCTGAGEEAQDVRCSKCRRMGLDCVFVPLKKVGRPRRLPPSGASHRSGYDVQMQDETELLDEEEDEEQLKELVKSTAPAPTPWLPLPVVATPIYPAEEQQFRYQVPPQPMASPSVSPPGRPLLAAAPNSFSLPPNTYAPSPNLFDFDAILQHMNPKSIQLPRRLSSLGHETALRSSVYNLPLLAHQYLTTIHTFAPLLPSDEPELLEYLSTAPVALLVAVASLAQPEHETTFALPRAATLADLQAGLLAVHAAYGRGDAVSARGILKWCVDAIQALGWHNIDALDSNNQAPQHLSDTQLNAIRRVWFEVWSLDVMLSVLMGSKAFLRTVTYAVNLPEEVNESGTSPLSLRIRALSLLATCTVIPAGSSIVASHLRTLAVIGQNIALLARETFVASAAATMSQGPREAAAREQSFMASLIASAAIIYLYSAYASSSPSVLIAFPLTRSHDRLYLARTRPLNSSADSTRPKPSPALPLAPFDRQVTTFSTRYVPPSLPRCPRRQLRIRRFLAAPCSSARRGYCAPSKMEKRVCGIAPQSRLILNWPSLFCANRLRDGQGPRRSCRRLSTSVAMLI